MACTIIRRTSIIMLTPSGRLLPLILAIIPPIGIPMLDPLTLIAIPAVGIAPGLVPLTVLAIPTIGIAPGLVPPMRLTIPAVRLDPPLLPLTIMAIPTIGLAAHLLPLIRLPIPAVSMGPRLVRVESLTIRLPGKGTIRSGLGAQGAQSHKQTQRENNAPPSSWSHFIILLYLVFIPNLFQLKKAAV